MKLVPPTGDRNMEQFLKTAAATAQLDLDEGRDIVSRRFRNRTTRLSTDFAEAYAALSRALADRRVLVRERETAVRNLVRVYRAVRNNLVRQGALGLVSPSILGRLSLKPGRQPIPTKMDAWITLAEKMQTVFTELTAEGRAPVTTPSPASLNPLLAEAVEKTTALNAKHGEIKEIRDRIKRQRAAALRLHGALMTHIRANLYGEEAATIRDTLRRYGYVYTGDRKAPDDAEETEVTIAETTATDHQENKKDNDQAEFETKIAPTRGEASLILAFQEPTMRDSRGASTNRDHAYVQVQEETWQRPTMGSSRERPRLAGCKRSDEGASANRNDLSENVHSTKERSA